MHLINTATAGLNNILNKYLHQHQEGIDCLASNLVCLINQKYDSLIRSDQTEVSTLLNAASNILEYPSTEARPLLNNTDKKFERLDWEAMRDGVQIHSRILKDDIFNARLLFLKSLIVNSTHVNSFEGFGRCYMPCLEYMGLSS